MTQPPGRRDSSAYSRFVINNGEGKCHSDHCCRHDPLMGAEGTGRPLAGGAQLVGHRPTDPKVTAHAWVAGSVPDQGACKRQLIDVSLSHRCFYTSLSPSFPLSFNKKK